MSPEPAAPNGSGSGSGNDPKIGPHPGFISSNNQFTTEAKLRALLLTTGCDPSREIQYRLQGVQLIDSVRTLLRLPVRTFDTASVYFHKFRLNFPEKEYNYQDAALASLFVACKVEDTIKKSKDILAAAYNVKNPEKPLPADDKMFDSPSKSIIGLERLILETIGFDFRTRYPQKLLVKTIRRLLLPPKTLPQNDSPDNYHTPQTAKSFFNTAYAMSIDLYKTFTPLKRTTFAMVLAIIELTARVTGGMADVLTKLRTLAEEHKPRYSRTAVTETMLDLLELYVGHGKNTRVGVQFDQGRWMEVMITINTEREKSGRERYLKGGCSICEEEGTPSTSTNGNAATTSTVTPGQAKILTPTTPASTTSDQKTKQQQQPQQQIKGQDATMRFIFDPESAKAEKDAASQYFNEEFEEYEVEIDEPVPPPPQVYDRGRGRGRGRGGMMRGGGGGGGPFWRDRGSPYGGGYRGDRGGYRGRFH